MKSYDGYLKRKLGDSYVNLTNGGHKSLGDFLGSIQWDATNKKILYKASNASNWSDLLLFGSNAFNSTDYVDVSGDTMTGALTGTRIWLNYNSNLSSSYSWTNAALTVPSIEILNYIGDGSDLLPTLAMHWYGHGGPQITVDKTSLMWITSAEPNSAGTLPTSTTYFKNLLLKCSDAKGIYVNGTAVSLEGHTHLTIDLVRPVAEANAIPGKDKFGVYYASSCSADGADGYILSIGTDDYYSLLYIDVDLTYKMALRLKTKTSAWNDWVSILTSNNISNYYWANIPIQSGTDSTKVPTFGDIVVKGVGEDKGLKLYNSDNTYNVIRFYNSSNTNVGYIHYFYNYYASSYPVSGVKTLNISGDASTKISLGSWISPTMLILSGGNLYVGIRLGLNAPSYPLHVNGDTYINGMGYFKHPSASQTINIGYNTATWGGGASTHPMIWGGDGTSYYTMIATPHIPYLENGKNGYTGTNHQGAFIRFAANYTANNYWDIGCFTADYFSIGRNHTGNININNSGYVGINCNATASMFGVYGGLYRLAHLDSTNSTGCYLSFYESSTERAGVGHCLAGDGYTFLWSLRGTSASGTAATTELRVWDNGGFSLGGTIHRSDSSWYGGTTVIGRDGYNKAIIGYLSSVGLVVGAHNSACDAWAPLYLSGTNIYLCYLGSAKFGTDSDANYSYVPIICQQKNTWLNPARLLLLRYGTNTYTDRACVGVTDGNLHIDAYHNKDIYMNFYSSGNIRFGYLTSSYYITPGGLTYFANYYTTSDRSKKQNISSFSEHIRKFQMKDTEKWHYGVIAQEVEEMFRDGEEGNMTVNYNSVLSYYIGLLENKVKELEEKIKLLETK